MVTTKQRFKRINQLASAWISVEISVQFQKIPIPDIENFPISAADILPIRYIGTPLLKVYSLFTVQIGITCTVSDCAHGPWSHF